MVHETAEDGALRQALEALALRDPDIARAYELCGLPPARHQVPGFPGLLRIMIAQQVSAYAARAIISRLNEAADPLTPQAVLALDDAALRRIGFSRQKVAYARALAEQVLSRQLDLDRLALLDDEAAIAHLIRAKGVGRWTAEIYLLFALQRPDVWPADDLAVQLAAQRLKGMAQRPSRPEMMEIAAPWRPYRSAAARLLWHLYRHPGVPTNGG